MHSPAQHKKRDNVGHARNVQAPRTTGDCVVLWRIKRASPVVAYLESPSFSAIGLVRTLVDRRRGRFGLELVALQLSGQRMSQLSAGRRAQLPPDHRVLHHAGHSRGNPEPKIIRRIIDRR